ncbi:MAG: class IV adenylate cyclase [Candidatus Doudnabacteria bacterium]|nr:class IV adenylate cyclase [Candidatus Doudnabacteria bacterium]
MNKHHKEVEVRFLEIDKGPFLKKLADLGAQDLGEDLLEEIIFYDKGLRWQDDKKFVRLRKQKNQAFLTYKNHASETADGTEEIEFEVSDMVKAEHFLERLGFMAYRHQQKLRHTFKLGRVLIEIDRWPRIPTYVELEGESEEDLKAAASQLDLDWNEVVFENARIIIENKYNIPVGNMKWFTFDKFE